MDLFLNMTLCNFPDFPARGDSEGGRISREEMEVCEI